MIRVVIELISAINGTTTELGRMYIANDGSGSLLKGNYTVAVCRKGNTEPPKEIFKSEEFRSKYQKASRAGKVLDYPRVAYSVWRLISRSIIAVFPEEGKSKSNVSCNIAPEIMSGASKVLSIFTGTRDSDIQAFADWVLAGNREPDHVRKLKES